ncbi:MAG: nuclear transport factor 2 family protein, partial [Ardenticatenaceae bacterium]|nr:nuclear transport factor 2 family protein [Ardenticatenaceae bacterium]
ALWHDIVASKDTSRLGNLLADDILFYSPVFWQPKQGKMAAFIILSTVIEVFEDFVYRREWLMGNEWALEFSARIGDKQLKGLDLITFDESGKIVRFEVLIRPLNGLQALGMEMGQRLAKLGIDIKQ